MTVTAAGSRKETRSAVLDRRSILALDYGRARIGLALADADARLPRPLGTLARKNRNEDLRRLREVIREHAVRRLVVGLPLRLDGSRGEMAEEAARFAERLRKQTGLPVTLQDERLSSWEAEENPPLDSRRKEKKKQAGKASLDARAAAVILRDFLAQDESAGGNG